ncbi:MAG: HAMP domain-containing sensor histidine kinase [Terricaulis sp.]
MRVLKLHDSAMLATARARSSSLTWRTVMGALFGAGASLALDSLWLGGGWFALLCVMMGADYLIGQRYIAAKTEKARNALGAAFVAGSALTQITFVAMTVMTGVLGGADGRVLSMLMAASSLVSGMLFLNRSAIFMLITLAPTVAWLVVSPFFPFAGGHTTPLNASLAMAFGMIGFLAYVWRSLENNSRMIAGLEAANASAKERQVIAEARQAEAEEANRVKSEFLTTMTHELRTPLNAVIGYSEIIGEDMEAEGHKDLAQDAKRITAAAKHLLGLIDQILQLTQIDSGRSALELDELDVRQVIESAVASVAEQAKANNNRLATRIASDVTFAYTDGEKLGVCIGHLLSNAVKFTNNGLVAVSAEREAVDGREFLRIAVSDTGVGMLPDEIEKAFQPFTQLDGSRTRSQGGMGLGLSITTRTAEVLGGEIAAVSEPGTGSTFTLRVPMRFGFGDTGESGADARIGAAA